MSNPKSEQAVTDISTLARTCWTSSCLIPQPQHLRQDLDPKPEAHPTTKARKPPALNRVLKIEVWAKGEVRGSGM